MKKIIKIYLEKEELFWIKKVEEAFNLVPMKEFVKDIEYDPFKLIRGNDFTYQDANLAMHLVKTAAAKRISIYKKNTSSYGAAVIANCNRALEIFENFIEYINDSQNYIDTEK